MAAEHRAKGPLSCPRCQGPLYPSMDADYCCLYCGEYVYGTSTRDPAAGWDDLLPRRSPAPLRSRRKSVA